MPKFYQHLAYRASEHGRNYSFEIHM